VARANPPINVSLRRDLAAKVPDRVTALGQTVSGWLAILVHNDGVRPHRDLAALANDTREVRVDLGCTLRGKLRDDATRQAEAVQLSRNAYLEAIVAADLATGGPLTILVHNL
jgi:hypothetical protein